MTVKVNGKEVIPPCGVRRSRAPDKADDLFRELTDYYGSAEVACAAVVHAAGHWRASPVLINYFLGHFGSIEAVRDFVRSGGDHVDDGSR